MTDDRTKPTGADEEAARVWRELRTDTRREIMVKALLAEETDASDAEIMLRARFLTQGYELQRRGLLTCCGYGWGGQGGRFHITDLGRRVALYGRSRTQGAP